MSRICAFDGCGKVLTKKNAKGFCSGHYQQFKAGKPLTVIKHERPRVEWLYEHVAYSKDDCLIWPYARITNTGRGLVRVENGYKETARYMCELAHGEPPTPDHEAAHSCGRGHDGCVNPRHLRWKTHAENMAEMVVHGNSTHGERSHWAKLREGQVHAIREFSHNVSISALADLFDVTPASIRNILSGKTWGRTPCLS